MTLDPLREHPDFDKITRAVFPAPEVLHAQDPRR
jgi:hypothetical protein